MLPKIVSNILTVLLTMLTMATCWAISGTTRFTFFTALTLIPLLLLLTNRMYSDSRLPKSTSWLQILFFGFLLVGDIFGAVTLGATRTVSLPDILMQQFGVTMGLQVQFFTFFMLLALAYACLLQILIQGIGEWKLKKIAKTLK